MTDMPQESTDIQEQADSKPTDEQAAHIKGVIETILFVNEKPVTLEQIKGVLETVTANEMKKAVKELQDELGARKGGVKIIEIAGGYQMLSNPAYAGYVREFYKTKHKEKLSKPALESLAIVAYKQPVTRADIEAIRSVNSDGIVTHLLDKELIKVVGRKDTPGNPFQYGTTRQFLEYFGLKSLQDLPKLEEIAILDEKQKGDLSELDTQRGDQLNSLERMKQSAISEERSEASQNQNVENTSAEQKAVMTENNEDVEDPEEVLKEAVQTLKVQKAALAKAKQFLEEAEEKNTDNEPQ